MRSILSVVVAFGVACGDDSTAAPDAGHDAAVDVAIVPDADTPDAAHPPIFPEPPAIVRDVSMIGDDDEWNHPFVPGHRTTMDGRVALRVQGGPPGGGFLRTSLSFSLFVPERLEEAIMPGPAGAEILAEPTPFDVVFPPALEDGVERFGHHALCDATTEFPVDGEQPNPQPCGHAPENDCYAITIISTIGRGFDAQLWGTEATVEVAEPKTPTAHLVNVTLGEPVPGLVLPFVGEFTEPAVTLDGRLLTGRLGRVPREWTNPETGEVFIRPYDLAYAVLPPDASPCDVTGWTQFHPMSHAPFDPEMRGYGLAAYPFRDSEGELIPDGEELGGTYPWVDREGANVFMAAVHGRVAEQSETQYPRRCVHEGCESFRENTDWDRGFMVSGLWTHGKFVLVDGMIHNQDWAVGVAPTTHWWVDLYQETDGSMMPIRFGGGRYIDANRGSYPYPGGYTHNANILDSLQNLPNFVPVARPVTPRDVVWLMSSGVATDEIAFDDLLDPAALIVSNMQASVTQLYDRRGESTGVPVHHNGQVRTPAALPILSPTLEADQVEEIHVQNAATSLSIEVPAYGFVEAGTARIEPVALGGVHGRGFWLDGQSRIIYPLPEQDLDERDAYLGIFVDARADGTLLTFGDETEIALEETTLRYRSRGVDVHEVALPAATGWRHLAWQVSDAHRTITLLVDGFAFDRFDAAEPLFTLSGGDLVVGRSRDTGVRGWIDDFVALVHDVNSEVACNHAGGTLLQVNDDATWRAVAERYPAWAHEEVASESRVAGPFACFHDYERDYGAHLQNAPAGTVSIREAINFPEGPVRTGAPRPDSSSNEFCLSCHTAEGRGGLGLDALEFRPGLLADDDPRRQPLQPPRRVFGNIPAGWIPPGEGMGSPDTALQAPPEGLVIDPWVLPR
ncbi:MAG: hypothetical protein AAGE52_15020 [Myxococcota bacterium]